MSVSVLAVSDSRLGVASKFTELVVSGSPESTTYTINASNATTVGNLNFNTTLPTETSTVRGIQLQYTALFTFSGATGSGNLVVPGSGCALKPIPLQSQCINSSTIVVNGTSFSGTPNESADFQNRLLSPEQQGSWQSLTPCMPDSYQQYSDEASLGYARSNLTTFGNVPWPNVSNGGYPYTVVSTSPNTTVIQVTVTEPLLIPPFTNTPAESEYNKALFGVNNIQLQMQYGATLDRMWAFSSTANPITTTTVSFVGTPQLLITCLNANDSVQKVPETQVFSGKNYVMYTTPFTLTSGSSSTVQQQAISLQNVPQRVICYARRRLADRTSLTTDTYASLTSMQVQWNNKTGILANLTPASLYLISRRNGYQQSFAEWSNYSGSLMMFSPADLSLPDLTVPNAQGNVQLQVQATFKNISSGTINYLFYLWVEQQALMVMDKNYQIQINMGYLTKEEILRANGKQLVESNIVGGSLLDRINQVGDVYQAVKRISPFVKPFLPLPASLALSAVGLGARAHRSKGKKVSHRKKKSSHRKKKGKSRGRGIEESESSDSDNSALGGGLIDENNTEREKLTSFIERRG